MPSLCRLCISFLWPIYLNLSFLCTLEEAAAAGVGISGCGWMAAHGGSLIKRHSLSLSSTPSYINQSHTLLSHSPPPTADMALSVIPNLLEHMMHQLLMKVTNSPLFNMYTLKTRLF
jgi:hypothetical protein